MFVYLILSTKGDNTIAIFTLDNKIEWIQSITCNHVSTNKTTLPVSKEEDIVAFVKTNKNESKFPEKKLTFCVVFI